MKTETKFRLGKFYGCRTLGISTWESMALREI